MLSSVHLPTHWCRNELLRHWMNERPISQLFLTLESWIVQERPFHVHQLNVWIFIMFLKEKKKKKLNLCLFQMMSETYASYILECRCSFPAKGTPVNNHGHNCHEKSAKTFIFIALCLLYNWEICQEYVIANAWSDSRSEDQIFSLNQEPYKAFTAFLDQ